MWVPVNVEKKKAATDQSSNSQGGLEFRVLNTLLPAQGL